MAVAQQVVAAVGIDLAGDQVAQAGHQRTEAGQARTAADVGRQHGADVAGQALLQGALGHQAVDDRQRGVLVRGLAPRRPAAGTVPVLGQGEGLHRRQMRLGGVAERRMADVMEQAGAAGEPVGVVEIAGGDIGEAQAAEAGAGQVHDAQAVLEAVVHGAGIDQVHEAQLADVPEALHPGMVDDAALGLVDDDRPVDGIADLVGVRHGSVPTYICRGRRKLLLR
jgi:hypothetical protein